MKLKVVLDKASSSTVELIGLLVIVMIFINVWVFKTPMITLDMSIYPFYIIGMFTGSVLWSYLTKSVSD